MTRFIAPPSNWIIEPTVVIKSLPTPRKCSTINLKNLTIISQFQYIPKIQLSRNISDIQFIGILSIHDLLQSNCNKYCSNLGIFLFEQLNHGITFTEHSISFSFVNPKLNHQITHHGDIMRLGHSKQFRFCA